MGKVERYRELFKSLASEKRLRILLALTEGEKSFTELLRLSGCGSSGELAFHLNRLEGLTEKGREGRYRLTELGVRFMATMGELDRIIDPEVSIEEQGTSPCAMAAAAASTLLAGANALLGFMAWRIEGAAVIAATAVLTHILLLTLYRFRYTLIKRYPYLINLPAMGIVLGSPDFTPGQRGRIIQRIFQINLYVALYLQLLFALIMALIILKIPEDLSAALITAASLAIIPAIIAYYGRIYGQLKAEAGGA